MIVKFTISGSDSQRRAKRLREMTVLRGNNISHGVAVSWPVITQELVPFGSGKYQTLSCYTRYTCSKRAWWCATWWCATSFIRETPKQSEKGDKIVRRTYTQGNSYLLPRASNHLLGYLASILNTQPLNVFRRSLWLLWSWNWPIDMADANFS